MEAVAGREIDPLVDKILQPVLHRDQVEERETPARS